MGDPAACALARILSYKWLSFPFFTSNSPKLCPPTRGRVDKAWFLWAFGPHDEVHRLLWFPSALSECVRFQVLGVAPPLAERNRDFESQRPARVRAATTSRHHYDRPKTVRSHPPGRARPDRTTGRAKPDRTTAQSEDCGYNFKTSL
jgi:hypothetical protein